MNSFICFLFSELPKTGTYFSNVVEEEMFDYEKRELIYFTELCLKVFLLFKCTYLMSPVCLSFDIKSCRRRSNR